MIILKTKRLILRTWEERDIDPMAAINSDPKVCEFVPKLNQLETGSRIKNWIKYFEHPNLAEGHSLRQHVLYRLSKENFRKNKQPYGFCHDTLYSFKKYFINLL